MSRARTADALALNVVVTSALGFAFWIAAARLVPSAELGRDAALLSALLTLSAMCQLNLTTAMLRFLPVTHVAPGRAIAWAYAVVATLSIAAATGFALLAPRVSERFTFLAQDPWLAFAFVVAAAAWGIFTLQDAVLTALGRSAWVPVENALFGAVKIALLPVLLVAAPGHAIFVAWIAATLLLVVPVNILTFRRAVPGRPRAAARSPLARFGRRGLVRFSAGDLGGTLFGHAASTMLPVVVAALVGTAESAHFFIPFTIVAAFDLVFLNVAAALTVDGAADEARLTHHVVGIVKRFAPLLAAGVIAGAVVAPLVLALYGPEYSAHGTDIMRVILCASAFRAAQALYVAVCRVQGRGGRILAVQGAACALVLGLTAVLAPAHGIDGVATAWLLANAVVATAVLPSLFHVLRSPSCAPSA